MAAFTYTLPVRFADVDHAGIVYYPRYFHYFHLTFEEFWRARMGPRAYLALLDDERIGFPSVKAECSYKGPLRFGDDAEVEMSITRLGNSSITFRYRVYKAGPTRTLCAEGSVVTAVVDLARFVAVPTPAHVRDVLADIVEA